ncbi:MAG: S8 family serine peptidase [Candidatus Cloacimonetes bacterium]|nr:S8 family serine peptidase [Candidatus Cloacimonadota bacterium]
MKNLINSLEDKGIRRLIISSFFLIIALSFSFNNLFGEVDIESYELFIKFNMPIQPSTQDGILFVEIPEFDDISYNYEISDFEFFHFDWSANIHYLLAIILEDLTIHEALDIFNEYEKLQNQYFVYIELHGPSNPADIPHEFLYYDQANPPYSHYTDTLGLVHDNGYGADWIEIYKTFQYEEDGTWIQNSTRRSFLEKLCPPGTVHFEVVDPPDPSLEYYWIVRAPLGMWHHTEMYNNTYQAWQYAKGDNIVVLVSDAKVNIDHPGLAGRLFTGYPNHYHGYSTHGTHITGVICAVLTDTPETTLGLNSAIGIAPESQYIAIEFRLNHLINFLGTPYINYVKVLNMSWSNTIYAHSGTQTTWDMVLTNLTSHPDQGGLDIFVASARAYSASWRPSSPNDLYPYSLASDYEGFMSVGALDPHWTVVSSWTGDLDSLNVSEAHFKSSINAPGHLIWTTGPKNQNTNNFQLSFAGATSGASPQVAGAAALIRSRYPWMTAAQTERQITLGAKNLDLIIEANRQPGSPVANWNVPDHFWGAGTLDVLSALYLHGDFTEYFEQTDPNETMLLGKEFELINSSMYIQSGVVRIEKDAVVTFTSSELVIGDGVEIIFEGNSRLVIDQFSEITIGNDVVIIGYGENPYLNENNVLVVYGSGQEKLLENLTVTNCLLKFVKVDLTIRNSTFDYSGIHVYDGDLDISGSTIDNSYGHSVLVAQATNVDLNGMNISNSGGTGIQLNEVNQSILIENVNIQNSSRNGINISNTHPISRRFRITDSLIENSVLPGILLYNSTGLNIKNVIIRDNKVGVMVLNKSSVRLEDSIVRNNENQEVYYDYSSTLLFDDGYNEIYDNSYTYGEPNQYLVFRLEGVDGLGERETVYMRNNYWGYLSHGGIAIEPPEYRFNPPCLTEAYIITPLYTPSHTRQDNEATDAQIIFLSAMSEMEEENYTTAEVLLKELIEDYSSDEYAMIAAKYLVFRIGKLTDNYTGVKNYLQNLDFESTLPDFANIILYLTNYCDIYLQDYNTAISWFEDYIDNPHTQIDSVFAMIDLAYTYLLSQDSGRSSVSLKYKECAVRNIHEYHNLQSSLLDNFLFGFGNETEEGELPENRFFVLNQSYPNPFYPGNPTRSGGVTISFTIPKSSNVKISVYNIKGQLVETIFSDLMEEGSHQVVWSPNTKNGRNVASGIYFYKLEAGNHSQVRKMLILK